MKSRSKFEAKNKARVVFFGKWPDPEIHHIIFDDFLITRGDFEDSSETELEFVLRALRAIVEKCEYHAFSGTQDEATHFLAVEARGNYLDIVEDMLEKK